MNNDKQVDAFTYHILNNIDNNVLASLSPSHLSSITEAIKASKPKKKHPIDIRGMVKLFFAQYYFVFLMGRDRRISTQELEIERRQDAGLLGNMIFLVFVISPFILLMIIALYFFKIVLGIDLFPGQHMGWIFGL